MREYDIAPSPIRRTQINSQRLNPSQNLEYQQFSRRKNAIINGNFNTWQRGTSFTTATIPTASQWSVDRDGAAEIATSRSTDVPDNTLSNVVFNYSMLLDCTTADTSLLSNDQVFVQTRIEGFNWRQLALCPCTLSFWVKATKIGIYSVSLVNSGLDQRIVKEYEIYITDTWEQKTLSFPASPAAGTWDYINGIGIYLSWMIMSGTNYQSSVLDTWQSGAFSSISFASS